MGHCPCPPPVGPGPVTRVGRTRSQVHCPHHSLAWWPTEKEFLKMNIEANFITTN